MDSRQVIRVPVGRAVGSAVLGLVLGALLPLLALFQVTLLVPVLMLGGMLAVWLRARAGWWPAIALAAAATASTAFFMGVQVALMLLAAALLPSLVVLRGMSQKAPFFDQMKVGIAAYVAGLLTATVIAYVSFGGGMVARFVDLIRAEYDRMPDAALQPFVEWANSMMVVNGTMGVERMTVDLFRAQLTGVLDLMEQTYAQALPGTLLCGAMLSGVLSVLWGNWTMARQGLATNESFVGMSRWFLPAQVTLGALGLWLAGVVLVYSGYESGATVSFTIGEVAGAVFAIQALSALDRRMVRAGRSTTRRRVLITLLAAVALILRDVGAVLAYVGVASALFGSHGVVRRWQQQADDPSNHDDPDE